MGANETRLAAEREAMEFWEWHVSGAAQPFRRQRIHWADRDIRCIVGMHTYVEGEPCSERCRRELLPRDQRVGCCECVMTFCERCGHSRMYFPVAEAYWRS